MNTYLLTYFDGGGKGRRKSGPPASVSGILVGGILAVVQVIVQKR